MALMAFAATSASATTLEVNGVTQNQAVALTTSLEGGVTFVWARTDGTFANTCTSVNDSWQTSVFTGSKVTGPINSLTFESCSRAVTVHNAGRFYVEHESGTTNGKVFSEETEVTVGTSFGTVNCKSGSGTSIGTLTGATSAQNSSAHATLHFHAVFNCGFLAPSLTVSAAFTVTSPTDLGVSA